MQKTKDRRSVAAKLVSECEKNLSANEYNTRRFKKVLFCTASDIETIKLYAETISRNGSYSGLLMQPRGNVAAVLVNCGLFETC